MPNPIPESCIFCGGDIWTYQDLYRCQNYLDHSDCHIIYFNPRDDSIFTIEVVKNKLLYMLSVCDNKSKLLSYHDHKIILTLPYQYKITTRQKIMDLIDYGLTYS